MSERDVEIRKAIEACRMLITSMADPHKQPLEREAGYILARVLRMRVEALGLLDDPTVREFMAATAHKPEAIKVRRYPDDFDEPLSYSYR